MSSVFCDFNNILSVKLTNFNTMKRSTSTTTSSMPQELQVTMIKKTKDVYSQEVKMKLPNDTTFECIIEFMTEQGLLKDKNVIVRPYHKENYIINHDRKISECYNLIKLRFIVQQVKEGKEKLMKNKIQALRNKDGLITNEKESNSICGNEQCSIM